MLTLQQIVDRLGPEARLEGDPGVEIAGVAPLRSAEPGQIAFLAGDRPELLADLARSQAGAIVLAKPELAPDRNRVVVADPVLAFDQILGMFPTPQSPPQGVDGRAVVDPSAELAEGVAVGAGAVVQAGCRIGPRTVIWPNVFVGRDCRIGADCVLHPGVVLREQSELGDRVILQPNVVIGADGFGYRTDRKTGIHHKVPQVGRVVIEDDVEVGANATIDRAKFGATRVGRGSKIDNLCQIAHNVQIGAGCLIAALCGIAGSTELEHHVVLAGHVGIRDNIVLGAGTVVTACSCVSRSYPAGSVLGGRIAKDHQANMREMVLTSRLGGLFDTVKDLAQRLEAMERAAADDSKAG